METKNNKCNDNTKKTNLNHATKQETNTFSIIFLITIVVIVGFFLFKNIYEKEKINKETLIIDTSHDTSYETIDSKNNTEDKWDGITILNIQDIVVKDNKIYVNTYTNHGVQQIKPNNIKTVDSGVSWIGMTQKNLFLKEYTLYIRQEEYAALGY